MSSRKKVFESTTVDTRSGEIVSSVTHWVDKSNESFGMLRLTEGENWIFSFDGNELAVLIQLFVWSNKDNGRMSLTKNQRTELCNTLKIKERRLYGIIKNIVEKNGAKRESYNDFIVNPSFLYKCSSNQVKERIAKYNEI